MGRQEGNPWCRLAVSRRPAGTTAFTTEAEAPLGRPPTPGGGLEVGPVGNGFVQWNVLAVLYACTAHQGSHSHRSRSTT